MKALSYTRVSTEQQAIEGVSLENQRQRIEAYCQYKGFDIVGAIEDAGISGGKNKARAGFVELLSRLEAGDVEVLVLYSLERLSRDMLTLLSLERLLDEYDIQLHTVEGQIDTSSPDGWMSFAMKSFLGEMERRQVKHRTKKAMEHKKSQGEVVGSVPFGYDRIGSELKENLEEQGVIKMVNSLYQAGKKLSQICKQLAEEGIKTRSGKDFQPMQVKRLIEGYTKVFTRSHTKLGSSIKDFVMNIG